MLESLQYKSSPRKMKQELNGLTSFANQHELAYDTAYDKSMERIHGQVHDQQKLAEEALSWITCAKRPLTALELRTALAVELGEPTFYEDNMPDLEDIISACAGLVTTVARSSGDVIRLVHATAKEYFERKWTIWFPDAHCRIATACVTYLSFDDFKEGICPSQSDLEARLHRYPLYPYACVNWGHHSRSQPIEETLMLDFLRNSLKIDACVQGLFSVGGYFTHSGYDRHGPPGFTGLHLAAYFGLLSVVNYLLLHCDHASTKDSMGRVPLFWAAYNGHTKVVEVLLNQGEVAELKDALGRTPISSAASMGQLDVVNCFLDQNVDPNIRDTDNRTPLSWAAYRGHYKVVRSLLERGADPDPADEYGRTPLLWASYDGWVEIVELLRERDVDIETSDKLGRTALSWASENGHVVVVKLLLEKGARLDSKDLGGRTPLDWAIQSQHEPIQLLLRAVEKSEKDFPRFLHLDAQLEFASKQLLADSPGPSIFKLGDEQTPTPSHNRRSQIKAEGGLSFQCALCKDRSFLTSNRHILRRHVMDLHFPRFQWVCSETNCSRPFQRKDKFITHFRTQHNSDVLDKEIDLCRREERFPESCLVCNRQVNSWEVLYTCLEQHAQTPFPSEES